MEIFGFIKIFFNLNQFNILRQNIFIMVLIAFISYFVVSQLFNLKILDYSIQNGLYNHVHCLISSLKINEH